VSGLRVGILGLGKIGRVVADRLTADGFRVTAVRRPEAHDFPHLVDSAATLAAASDVVIAALATEASMRDAYLGADGLAVGARNGLVIVDMGTFPVALKREIADALAARGAAMLDCPISGTPPVVREGRGVLFVSGDPAAIGRCQAVIDCVAPTNHVVGAFGAGMAVKLVANFLVMAHTLAAAQAMLLGTHAGIDGPTLIKAIGPSFAGSPVFSSRAPLMTERRYQPAPGPASILLKDLAYIEAECARLGVEMPFLAPGLEWFKRMIAAGRGNDEIAGVYEMLEAASSGRS
jgi:3-hydroxyisobutyrate dehydrogenase-like beta-hydroxyacid dehydrogenase